MASPVTSRTAALSLQLAQAHRELRRRLADVRAALGRRPLPDDDLPTHCLAFCTALTDHHEGEDSGLFAALVRERPDLAPTVAKLVEDHGMIGGILARVRELAEQAAREAGHPEADLTAIGRELDGLAAIMDSHFGYEERAIGAALDAGAADAGDGAWREPVLRLRAPKTP
ncbi:hemerythrin domain-containing protein [Kitasatospora sp. NPDC089797]|uniref:hemerythrin domain-containing protein n=1 Tax=Kitasatospora sp. NPDC089797 TaxID=3155298 RepID=UPI003418FCB6